MATKTATRTRKKATTTTIPSFGQIEKQVGLLRKDIERTVDRVSREAARYIPQSSRRQFGDLFDRVSDLFADNAKVVRKTVKDVREDVEDSVDDLRSTVTKKVEKAIDEVEDSVDDVRGSVKKTAKTLRKDADTVTKRVSDAIGSLEKEARKQVDRVLDVIGVPARRDIDGLKRRIGAIERKIDALVAATKKKRAASHAA